MLIGFFFFFFLITFLSASGYRTPCRTQRTTKYMKDSLSESTRSGMKAPLIRARGKAQKSLRQPMKHMEMERVRYDSLPRARLK